MYEVTAEKNVRRGAIGRNAKALVYSTLVAASVNNAYFQIVVSRVLSPGTVVMGGDAGHGREIVGLELLLASVAATRFFLISAFVLCVVLQLVVTPACGRLRGTRFGSLVWVVPGCGALGAIVGLALDQMRFPLAVGSGLGMVLAGMSAGAFLAFYLARRLRRET